MSELKLRPPESGPAFGGVPNQHVLEPTCCAGYVFLPRLFSSQTAGLMRLGGRRPSKKAITFSAAIVAMRVRVAIEAEPMCGARTTLARLRPSLMMGSRS